MNTNLSPPRRGFLVARSDVVDRTTCQVPRIDSIMRPSLMMGEPQMEMGVHKQKLPKVSSPFKEKKEKLSPRKSTFGVTLSSSFKDKCSVNSLSDADSSSTTLSTDETSPTSTSTTRRVRFQRDKHSGRVIGSPLPTQKKELTLYEIKQTWWTRTELRKCRERAQDLCREILENDLDYKMAVVRVLSRCGADHKPNIEAYPYYEQIFQGNSDEQNQSLVDEAEDLKKIIDCADTARGLEKRLLNVMEVPFYRHKRSVQAVLDTQSKMREKGYPFADMEREIASRYRRHCKYATKFASMIAECDGTAAGIRATI